MCSESHSKPGTEVRNCLAHLMRVREVKSLHGGLEGHSEFGWVAS